MQEKEVRIFDDSNNPLQVAGITIELFDAVTGTLFSSDNSKDLNPGSGGPSNEWGVKLSFTAGSNPLDIYISDPTYNYPGNTVRYLNGQEDDRLDIDLLKVGSGSGGQSAGPASASAASILQWIDLGIQWSASEKRAVRNLVFNYLSVIVPRLSELPRLPDLQRVATHWEEAMRRLNVPIYLLRP